MSNTFVYGLRSEGWQDSLGRYGRSHEFWILLTTNPQLGGDYTSGLARAAAAEQLLQPDRTLALSRLPVGIVAGLPACEFSEAVVSRTPLARRVTRNRRTSGRQLRAQIRSFLWENETPFVWKISPPLDPSVRQTIRDHTRDMGWRTIR